MKKLTKQVAQVLHQALELAYEKECEAVRAERQLARLNGDPDPGTRTQTLHSEGGIRHSYALGLAGGKEWAVATRYGNRKFEAVIVGGPEWDGLRRALQLK